MTTHPLRRAMRALAIVCCLLAGPVPAVAHPAMERVVSSEPPFVLVKPAGWRLRHSARGDTLTIAVTSPDGRSAAELAFSDNRTRHLTAVQLMATQLAQLRARHPDLAVAAGSTCRDQPPSCAEVLVSYTLDGAATRARYFLHADATVATVRSYRAPASRWADDRPLLLDVLTNIHVRERRPLRVDYLARRAADHSVALELPSDWSFVAGRGAVVAAAPRGAAGFVFTVFQVLPQAYGVTPPPGVIISGYQPPQAIIGPAFAQFRNRDIRVLASRPDAGAGASCATSIGRPCEAADLAVSWTSPEGVACVGGFKVLNARPNLAGQWFTIVAGAWGPASDLARHLPVLAHVAGSFAINDAYARRYIEQGIAHLREQQQRTRQAVSELYGAIEQNQRDYEARSASRDASQAKWDDYRRGNSYWVSDLEGGKVYQTDPWGTRDQTTGERYDGAPYSYLHFDGQNPAHPSEQMREISSDELRRLGR